MYIVNAIKSGCIISRPMRARDAYDYCSDLNQKADKTKYCVSCLLPLVY